MMFADGQANHTLPWDGRKFFPAKRNLASKSRGSFVLNSLADSAVAKAVLCEPGMVEWESIEVAVAVFGSVDISSVSVTNLPRGLRAAATRR